MMRIVTGIVTLLVALGVGGCRATQPGSFLKVDEADLTRIQDQERGRSPHVLDGLSREYRRARYIDASCGAFATGLNVLRRTSNTPSGIFFDEPEIWRTLPRPGNNCDSTESPTESACESDYGLAFFPSFQNNAGPFVVNGASPLIRSIPKDDYDSSKLCNFDNDRAIIAIMGIRNPDLGISWSLTDGELVAMIMAWNRTPELPEEISSSGGVFAKLSAPPAYIQLVGNTGTAVEGADGAHDEKAIATTLKNIELAWVSGVNHLEFITHSNGMITAHVALTQWAARLAAEGDDLRELRRSNPNASAKMKVQLFHFQAAPARKWSFLELDSYGSVSDFIPNARWVWRGRGPFGYWGWEWDFSTHASLNESLDLSFTWLYNRKDWYTYDPQRISTVGRRESIAWTKEVLKNQPDEDRPTNILHLSCKENDATCGPAHDQRAVLWQFSTPRPQWSNDFGASRQDQRLEVPMAASDAMEGLAIAAPPPLPQMVCLDGARSQTQCRTNNRQQPGLNLPNNLTMLCVNGSEDSPCTQSTCGDGVCGLNEDQSCEDCQLPDRVVACRCDESGCKGQALKCRGRRCTFTPFTHDTQCYCPVREQRHVKCRKSDGYCEMVEIPGIGCSRTIISETDSGDVIRKRCMNDECQTQEEGFSLYRSSIPKSTIRKK